MTDGSPTRWPRFRNRPFNLGVQYTLPVIRTRLNLTLLYIGESYYQLPIPDDPEQETIKNDDYTLFNAKITQPFLSDRLETFVAVENLFDEDYEPTSGYPGTGNAHLGGADLQDCNFALTGDRSAPIQKRVINIGISAVLPPLAGGSLCLSSAAIDYVYGVKTTIK